MSLVGGRRRTTAWDGRKDVGARRRHDGVVGRRRRATAARRRGTGGSRRNSWRAGGRRSNRRDAPLGPSTALRRPRGGARYHARARAHTCADHNVRFVDAELATVPDRGSFLWACQNGSELAPWFSLIPDWRSGDTRATHDPSAVRCPKYPKPRTFPPTPRLARRAPFRVAPEVQRVRRPSLRALSPA